MRKLKRVVSLVLVAALSVSNIQTNVNAGSAQEGEKPAVVKQAAGEIVPNNPVVVKELKKERTKDSNTYLLNNGMKKVTYYTENVRYEDENGKLQDYDNKLVKVTDNVTDEIAKTSAVTKKKSKTYAYENAGGDAKQYIPENIDEDTPVVLKKGGYAISFAPIKKNSIKNQKPDEENKDSGQYSAFSEELEEVEIQDETFTDIYDKEKTEKVKAVYKDKINNLELEYISQEQGIKENIILNEVPKTNVFAFEMQLENMTARLDEQGGGLTLLDEEKDEIVGGIAAPFMNDATNKAYSEDVYFTLEQVESDKKDTNKYILKMIADMDYLESGDRQYPVTIDPSVSWSGVTDLPEAYILSTQASTNYFSGGVTTFSVGRNSQGLFRTYLRAMSIKSIVSGKYVESANLTVYENGANTKGIVVEARNVSQSFKCGTITWSNRANFTSTIYSTITSSGTASAKKTFNLTQWARNVANGQNENYGLIFKVKDESVSSYVKFYGARHSTTAKRPKLEVVYYDGPTTASSVTATKTYLKSGQDLQVNWAGISSRALDYVQYRVANYDESKNESTTNYIEYSNSTKIGTTASGTKIISESSDWKEGNYKIFVRGVDKGGIKGTAAGAHFVIDRTAPDIICSLDGDSNSSENFTNVEPTLQWKVLDKYPGSVQVSVNGSNYKTYGYEKEDSDVDIEGLQSGKYNSIKIKAIDAAGNESPVSGFAYYFDDTEPEIKEFKTIPETDEGHYATEKAPELKYQISDSTLKTVEYYVNDSDYMPLEVSGTGQIKINSTLLNEGENVIGIYTCDKAGNESEDELYYYLDTVKPQKGEITVTPNTSSLKYRSALPVINWTGFEDENLKEIQVSINEGAYKTLGLNAQGTAQLEAADFTQKDAYKLKVRAIDKAGNVSEECERTYYYKNTVSEVAQYTLMYAYTVEKLNGNTLIGFTNIKGEFPGDIVYEVHRGTTPLFVPGEDTFVKVGGEDGVIEVAGEKGVTYYYKLRAVTADGEKKYSDYSEEISSTTLTDAELNGRCGTKDIYEYLTFSTPNGNGMIEQSQGNLSYEQLDLSLPAAQIPVELNRVYNSKSTMITGFGYGWSTVYDSYVAANADGSTVLYQDGTKAVYTFEKKEDKYECKDSTEIFLEKVNKYIEKEIEGEKIGFNSTYSVTNKDNEKYYFDDCGRLALIEEANETFLYIKYQKYGEKIEYVKTSAGKKITYTYEQKGTDNQEYITRIDIPDNSYFTYEYENDRLIKAVHHGKDGGTINYKYAYDENGYLRTIYDAKDNQYKFNYSNGKAVKVEYPNLEYDLITRGNNSAVVEKKLVNNQTITKETNTFDADGKVVKKIDALGNELTYEYDSKGLLKNSKVIKEYYFISNGRVSKTREMLDDKAEYDARGNVISQEDEEGNVTTYTYDNSDEVNKNFPTTMVVKDANGNITSNEKYEYNNLGNVIKTIDYITNTVGIYAYDSSGNVTKSVETLVAENSNIEQDASVQKGLEGDNESVDYDVDGNANSEEIKSGTVNSKIEYIYDEIGRVLSHIDEKAVKTTYEYDEFGRVIKTAETSKGKSTTTTSKYNDNGSLKEEVDVKGRKNTFVYDNMNRPTEQTLTVGEESKMTTTEYVYEGTLIHNASGGSEYIAGLYVVRTKNSSGKVTGETYTNGIGQIVSEVKDGISNEYTYDKNGKVFSTYTYGSINSLNTNTKTSVNIYDANGNLTNTILNPSYMADAYMVGADSVVTSNVYDKTGMLTKTIDANGNETTYEYDNQGRITKVNDASGNGNNYIYDIENKDAGGQLISTSEQVRDALGRVSETVLNGAGQTLSVTDKCSQSDMNLTTSYEYDTSGNVVKEINSDGSYVAYEYDEYNYNKKQTVYDKKGSAIKCTEYKYDVEYNLIETIDSNVSGETKSPYRYIIYEYDSFGRNTGYAEINSDSRPTDAEIQDAKITYVYDIEDRLVKMYYPHRKDNEFKGIKFKYNDYNLIDEICALVGDSETENIIREYSYYRNGAVHGIRNYDKFLTGGDSYRSRTYGYDKVGRVIGSTLYSSENPNVIYEQYKYTYEKIQTLYQSIKNTDMKTTLKMRLETIHITH